jgi:tripartite-type tricarboxylate transporter receptor subunit TctC
MKNKFIQILGSLIFLSQLCTGSMAQDNWPERPVKLIVSSSAGGGTDMYARLLAQSLSDALKQQFIVDNRPGASGNIGASAVAKSPADGYTFLVSANTSLTINGALYKNLTYDAEKDFTPIARALGPLVIVVHPNSKIRTLQELIETGKKEPNKLSFGSAGTGSTTYLGIRMLEEKTGAKFLHIPYKGVAPAYQDLLAGQIQFMMPDLASSLQLIKSGKVIPIVSEYKSPLIAGVPSMAELGHGDVNTNSSFSLVAPSATPSAIVERLHKELMLITKSTGFASKLEAQGLIAETDSLGVLSASMKKERENYASFIKRNAILPSD